MKRLIPALMLAGLTIGSLASATVGPPVEVVIEPFTELPEIGQPITLTFQLTSAVAGTVTDVGFISGSPNSTEPNPDYYWDIIGHTAPPSLPLAPMQTESFDMTMNCNDPSERIRVEFKFDGTWIRRDFFLLPLGANDLWEYSALKTVPGTETKSVVRDLSRAIPGLAPESPTVIESPAGGSKNQSTIRLYGRIIYLRPDALTRGADGVTVRAFQRVGSLNIQIGAQVTDASGNFDFNVVTGASPDIYLKVVMTNAICDVNYPSTTSAPYSFQTPIIWGLSGSEKNFGSLLPNNQFFNPALHIQSTITKAWRNLLNAGYAIPNISVQWPSGDNASYSPSYDIIYISEGKQWNEFTICHEYGHHFNDEFGADLNGGYCNTGDYGDDGDDCGHLLWCPESEAVAWTEGIADWFGAAFREMIEDEIGPTISGRTLESLAGCSDNGDQMGSFQDTEGFIAAFCIDAADGANDVDDSGFFGAPDKLSLGNKAILDLVNDYKPVTSVAFVNFLLDRYPAQRQKIWSTAANNRHNFDTTDPPSISTLYSTSHQTSGDSPDWTVDLWWNDVVDTDSGIDFYVIFVADNASFSGPNVDSYPANVGGTWTSPVLEPDTYWFRIYAIDAASNVSSTPADFGPVTIRQPTPPDLVPSHGTWPHPVIVKSVLGAPYEISPFLFGNIANSYFSMSVGNGGEQDANGTLYHRFYIDGVLYHSIFTVDLPSYWESSVVDVGPDVVRGGRHNLTFIADADEDISESDEDNNWYSKQYVWTGMGLNETWKSRGYAPDAWGGFQSQTIFSSPNCDGFSYSTQAGKFRGVVLLPAGAAGDFGDHDLRSFPLSTGSENGFRSLDLHASSSRPAGCLDAVFAVNDLTTATYFNVGAYNFTETQWGFSVRRIESVNINDQVETPITIAAGDFMNLYRVTMAGGVPGGDFGTLRVNSDPADGLLHAAVFDMATAHAGLENPLVGGQSDENGEITLDFNQINGRHMVAVWQDPKDAATPIVSIDATVWIGQTPPDLMPTTAAGWFVPVSPTDGAPGTPGSVLPPTQLQGNQPTTYLNFGIHNESPTMATWFSKLTYIDGVAASGAAISQLAGNADHLSNFGTPYTVQGGRHTVSGLADPVDTLSEISETNNAFGRQWVWSPYEMPAPGGWIIRSAPPSAVGGWDHVLASPPASPDEPPVFFNCDGLRTPMPGIAGDDGWWQATAILPQGTADYDVRLHEADTSGVDEGFKEIRGASTWAGQGSDFVLVNFRNSQPRQFDVGVVVTNGSKNYYSQIVESRFLGSYPVGAFGSFSMGGDSILGLHEVYLDPGPLTIRTVNQSGAIDWGMTLHRANLPYQSKTSQLDGSYMSWLQGGAGGDEEISVTIPEAGYYCVSVWRAGFATELWSRVVYELPRRRVPLCPLHRQQT